MSVIDDNDGTDPTSEPDPTSAPSGRRRKESVGQTIGGVLFGFEQQVLRTMPPPHELVHHARPDAPVAAGDGSLIHIGMPGLALPDEDADAERDPAGATPRGPDEAERDPAGAAPRGLDDSDRDRAGAAPGGLDDADRDPSA